MPKKTRKRPKTARTGRPRRYLHFITPRKSADSVKALQKDADLGLFVVKRRGFTKKRGFCTGGGHGALRAPKKPLYSSEFTFFFYTFWLKIDLFEAFWLEIYLFDAF